MAGQYATGTEVPSDRSRAEIEKTVTRYGATEFGYGWQGGKAVIMFTLAHRQMRFILTLPDRHEFRTTPTGRDRAATAQTEAWEQACRASWRSLALALSEIMLATEGIFTLADMKGWATARGYDFDQGIYQ